MEIPAQRPIGDVGPVERAGEADLGDGRVGALFRGRQIFRLDAGGTVVGLFRGMKYEQGKIQFEPGDVGALTEVVRALIGQEGARELAAAAARRISWNWSWRVIAERYRSTYAELIPAS